MTASLEKILKRAESWPDDARHELEQLAQDIETELGSGIYHTAVSELAGIDRGLRDAASGKFATAEQVENAFGKLRQ